MDKELKNKIKEAIGKLNEELVKLLEPTKFQFVILIYREEEFLTSGFDCKACANDTCAELIILNKDEKHLEIEKDLKVH
jgi:hypothetical protein